MNRDFLALDLPQALLGNLASLGYETMTPIQAATLPASLAGEDVIAQGQTGSGKTAAFGLAILAKWQPDATRPQALVLSPTRELSEQITGELRRLARSLPNVRVLSVCGGAQFGLQRSALAAGVDIVVGTPGRLLEHLDKGSLDLSELRLLVLDEADRMLDMGFLPSIRDVMARTPSERQTLLFSATYPEAVRALSRGYQKSPREISVDDEPAPAIDERFFHVEPGAAVGAVLALLARDLPESTLIFCNLKADCQRVVDALQKAGVSAVALNGDLEQYERDHVLLLFANKSCSVLVATDVAARGLDIKELSLVINFDLSGDPDVHQHRVGRTGRAGKSGRAYGLFSEARPARFRALEARAGGPLRVEGLPPNAPARLALFAPMATLILAAGRRDKLRPADVLGALTAPGGIAGADVGKIDVRDRETYVAVRRGVAGQALETLRNGRVKARQIKARPAALTATRSSVPAR